MRVNFNCKKLFSAALMLFFFSAISFAQPEENETTIAVDTLIPIDPDDIETIETNKSFNRLEDTDLPVFGKKIFPDSVARNLRSRDEFWYANYSPEKIKAAEEKKEPTRLVEQKWFRSLLWTIIIGGFLAFLLIYLQGMNVGLFRSSRKFSSQNGSEEDVITDDIFAINYTKEIDKAIRNDNYRFATRLMFLRLLRDLSDRKVISYGHEKTNLDYMMQLGSTTYFQDFSRVTRNYEYVWYGHFEVDKERFMKIQGDFENINRKL